MLLDVAYQQGDLAILFVTAIVFAVNEQYVVAFILVSSIVVRYASLLLQTKSQLIGYCSTCSTHQTVLVLFRRLILNNFGTLFGIGIKIRINSVW